MLYIENLAYPILIIIIIIIIFKSYRLLLCAAKIK